MATLAASTGLCLGVGSAVLVVLFKGLSLRASSYAARVPMPRHPVLQKRCDGYRSPGVSPRIVALRLDYVSAPAVRDPGCPSRAAIARQNRRRARPYSAC